jgi:hypothetical protein
MTAYFRADCSQGAGEPDARPGGYLPQREIRAAGISGPIAGRRLYEQTLQAKEGVRYG